MKEELLRVLNNKLDDINNNIDSLTELNNKISIEEEELSYVKGILNLFNENNIMDFVKLDKDDFNHALDILDDDVRELFENSSCSYDGLVYLINGINSGISLSLTSEQENAIKYFMQKLDEREEEHKAAIDGYALVKDRYEINDIDTLKNKKENYLAAIESLNKKEYVNDTDLVLEAITFSQVSDDDTVSILKYLLKYNADVYNNNDHDVQSDSLIVDNVLTEDNNVEDSALLQEPLVFTDPVVNYENDDVISNDIAEEVKEEASGETKKYEQFHFNNLDTNEFPNFEHLQFSNNEEENSDEISYSSIPELSSEDNDDSISFDNSKVEESENVEEEYNALGLNDIALNEEMVMPENDLVEEETSKKTVTTSDLQLLLNKYGIEEENAYINELVTGDNDYEDILNTLQANNLIDSFKGNSELLIETLLYSDSDTIKKVLQIIKNDLSVDDEDYIITTKIVINTIPSVFVKHGGNYDNFSENIKTFKDLDLNLINLFDFSKEVFVASHDTIVNNLEIVKKYDVDITYQNVKYLLLLSNIGDRLDYYVESVYEDKTKGDTFDGIEYINLYTAKLNVVDDETIKRLRYCSDNGKKVFGTKPKSLVGEITNLKVNSLDINGDYLDSFFNNEFAMLTGDEVREYSKLIHSSSNVGNYDDELDIIEKFHNGLRYVIDGINISYNKVVRNYSILRSYGIDRIKALHFAVCYNLVIMKDEYDKLKNTLDELGGNL